MKQPSKKTVIDTVALGAGTVAGGLVSKGANQYLAPSNPEEITEKTKKATMLKKAGIALLAGVGVAFVRKDGAVNQALKGGLVGICAEKTIGLVMDYAKTTTLAVKTAEDSAIKQFAQGALGLKGCGGCTSAQPTTQRLYHYVPMNAAVHDFAPNNMEQDLPNFI